MKKGGNNNSSSGEESAFESIKIRKTTILKLKAYKENTNVPMSAFVDKAVDERLKKLKFSIVK